MLNGFHSIGTVTFKGCCFLKGFGYAISISMVVNWFYLAESKATI
jgi:hypothetical protein